MLTVTAHPGELIREDILPAFGLSVVAACRVLKVNRPHFSRVLGGQAAVTPDMALKIEKAFGTSASLLVNMQAAFDLAEARGRDPAVEIQRQSLPAA